MGKRIGDFLISDGLVSEKTLARALELQSGNGRGTRLGAILLKWDLVGESDLLRTLAKMHHCPSVDWATISRAEKSVTRLLSASQAARLGALPYAAEGKRLRVAFTNPSNIAAVDEVQAITGRRVLPAVTSEVRMNQAHQLFYARPLSREMSAVLQKIESRRAGAPVAARPAPPPPPALAPAAPPSTPSEDAACSDVWVAEPPAPDMAELADSLIPLVDEQWPDGEATDAGLDGGEHLAQSDETPHSAPDPLADDGPLSNFLEGAIHYYGSASDLHEALASIELGPIEDLDESMFVTDEKPSRESLDETHPSGRFRRRRASGEVAL